MAEDIADLRMLEAARVLANQKAYKKAVAFCQESCTRLPNRADAERKMAVILLHQSIVDDVWESQYRRHHIGGVVVFVVGDAAGTHNVSIRLGSDAEPWGETVHRLAICD